MSEANTIDRSNRPATVESLQEELGALGVRPGSVLLVHSSLSALGWVCGGPVAVIEALMQVLGPGGTLAMPAHSGGLCEPSRWQRPPVPESWWPTIRATMPAFDARRTPTRGMGKIAELFRTFPGVTRSNHPALSMAACGPHAEELLRDHPLDDPLGEPSPLGQLYRLDASVLLLGVGHDRNTSLHLAERQAFGDRQARVRAGAPLRVDGKRRWVEYTDPDVDCEDFAALGAAFEAPPSRVRLGTIGAGVGRLMAQRELVDFGVPWLRAHRAADGSRASAGSDG